MIMATNVLRMPDVMVYRNGDVRLVSSDAKSWAYQNTTLSDDCTVSTVPEWMLCDESMTQVMEDDGLSVFRSRRYSSRTIEVGSM